MSSGFRTFYNKKICCSVILMRPHFQDQLRCSFGRNDWRNLRSASLTDQLRQIHRKSGTTDDHICPRCHCLFHMLRIMLQRNHNIYTDKTIPLRDFLCPLDVLVDCSVVTCSLILLKPFFIITNLSSRNYSDSAFLRHCSCERASADSNTHTALDNWNFCSQITYFQFFYSILLFVYTHFQFSCILF